MGQEDIRLATPVDIEKIIPVFIELRPHRTENDLRELFPRVFQEGYKVAFIGNERIAYAILGFRVLTFIFSGKTLKIDDLATHSDYRKNGYADKLFNWAKEYAINEKCDHINLDSGFQRHDAYRFYLNHGLKIESLHFGTKVTEL